MIDQIRRLSKRQLFFGGGILLLVLSIPLTMTLLRQRQDDRSRAEKATTIAFSPSSSSSAPIVRPPNQQFTMDVTLDPGKNLVSFVKLAITVDPQYFQGSFAPNSDVIKGTTVQTDATGKLLVELTTGGNPVDVIQETKKIGTLTLTPLKATTGTPTTVTFGSESEVLSIAPEDSANENVLSNTTPAYITIGTTSTTPVPSTVTPTNQPTPTGPVACQEANVDLVLLMDKSDSMKAPTSSSDPTPAMQRAKEAAVTFTNLFLLKSGNRLGLVSFSSPAQTKIDSPFVTDKPTINAKINALVTSGQTCTECGITNTNALIAANSRTGVKKVVILLTDGKATVGASGETSDELIEEQAEATRIPPRTTPTRTPTPRREATPTLRVPTKTPTPKIGTPTKMPTPRVATPTQRPKPPIDEIERKAIDAAKRGNQANGTVFYTIGLGRNVNEAFLREIATATGGKYYSAPTAQQLSTIYQDIAQSVGRGMVSGTVFEDANGNGVMDGSESGINNWRVSLRQSSANSGSSTTTDTAGQFAFTNVCDGSYVLSQATQDGWRQTVPANNGNYTFQVTKGSSSIGNFGNRRSVVTPTRPPVSVTPPITGIGGISVDLSLYLHTIGASGDNASPNNISGSNQNPKTPQRSVNVALYDVGNDQTPRFSTIASVTYVPMASRPTPILDEESDEQQTQPQSGGYFKGIARFTQDVPAGQYVVKTKTDRYLQARSAAITVNTKATNPVTLTMVVGDVDNNNRLNILDYNILRDCSASPQDPLQSREIEDDSSVYNSPVCKAHQERANTDLNDDGLVDRIDANYFVRELSVQSGQ